MSTLTQFFSAGGGAGGNGSNIVSLAEDMTIDKSDVSVTLYYVDATRGWRII